MSKLYRYYVTGVGQFPDDMLRYDRAKIVKTLEAGARPIYLLEGRSPPTGGRWQSFLWSVIDTPEKCARWGLPEVGR